MLREISSHLERRIHRQIKGELVCDSSIDLGRIRAELGEVHFEDTRGEVHRTAVETGERKDGHMHWLCSAKRLILSSSRALVADEVRIGAAETGRADSLMGIDHDMVLRSFLHGIEIVVVQPLAVVMLAKRQDITHVTALHCVVAVLLHEIVGRIHVSLIIAYR